MDALREGIGDLTGLSARRIEKEYKKRRLRSLSQMVGRSESNHR
jgi:hypothetical protein